MRYCGYSTLALVMDLNKRVQDLEYDEVVRRCRRGVLTELLHNQSHLTEVYL